MADKNVRDELAELTEAVRELRDREVADEIAALRAEVEKLRAERDARTCHGCHCGGHGFHAHCNWGHCGCWITHGYSGTMTWPQTFTVTTTNVASGCAGIGLGVNTAGTNALSISN